MKVKLTEHYQDAGHIFTPDQEVDVDDVLGAWLVKHGKAVALEAKPEPPHYGGQTDEELKPRNDEEIYAAMREFSDKHEGDEKPKEEPKPKAKAKRSKK